MGGGAAITACQCDAAVMDLLGAPEVLPIESELVDSPTVVRFQLSEGGLSISGARNRGDASDEIRLEPRQGVKWCKKGGFHCVTRWSGYYLRVLLRIARRVWLTASSSSSSRLAMRPERSLAICLRILATSWVPLRVI